MRIIAVLIVLAGVAGLVALLAPIDGAAVLPAMFEGDVPRALVLLAGFGIAVVLGGLAVAKERMSKLNAIACLVGFGAAAGVIKIWEILKHLGDNMPGHIAIMLGAIGLGLISSIAAIIKGRADY